MRQVFQKSYLSKELCVEEVPAPILQGTGILVRNAASLISPGTERATVSFARKSLIAKAKSQPERLRLLFRKMKQIGVMDTLQLAKSKLENPIPLGYSTAGMVLDVSPNMPGIKAGDRVACAGAKYANHADIVYIPKNLCVPLPDNLSYEEGSFVAPGAIALHGVRLAQIGLGETVLIIGLGLIGQLTAQLVRAQGGIPIGIDLDHSRLQLARELDITHVFHREQSNLSTAILELTQGKGVDAVLIAAATPSHDPIFLAGELCRERGKVVVVGDVGMQIPRSIYYHKELSIIVSRSYGPGRYDENYETHGQDYPVGYVRWTERENMAAFLQAVSAGKVKLKPLIDHRYPVEEAAHAYDLLTNPDVRPQPLGIVLTYPQLKASTPDQHRLDLRQESTAAIRGGIGVSIIGTGNFMTGTLLPILRQQRQLTLRGVASHSGLSAKNTASQADFAFCSTSFNDLIHDAKTDAVIITTRHDSHTALLCQALQAGKHVFVEKPMAINRDELKQCIEVFQQNTQHQLMVGFNRRFSPHSVQLKKRLKKAASPQPLTIHYRILAGYISEESWVHQHGGRVIGEICHFVDWCQFITGEHPVEVSAQAIGSGHNQDISIQLRFTNGSIAHIQYLMRIDPVTATAMGKEHIEVHSASLVAEIEDFKTLKIGEQGKVTTHKSGKPDKGHGTEIAAFIQALHNGQPAISFESLALTTETTFAILDALQTGESIPISLPGYTR